LFVNTVIVTSLPASPAAGVYVKLNGELLELVIFKLPAPFSLKLTLVALPPNVLPVIVFAVDTHVLPLGELKLTLGGLAHPQLFIVILPVAVVCVQLPVVVTVYECVPSTVDDPLIVNTPDAYVPLIPVGNPVTPAPVAPPPTLYEILVMPAPAHTVWVLFAVVKLIVAFEFTTTLIVAVFAHKPAVGVNVYTVVPALVVLIADGLHVPVTVLLEVVGNAPGVAPTQYAPN
jgi:hypothetical protein